MGGAWVVRRRPYAQTACLSDTVFNSVVLVAMPKEGKHHA